MAHLFAPYSHSGRAELEKWLTTPRGGVALQARLRLLRILSYSWPRRGKSVLVMTPGNALVPEMLHDSGFDVVVQEEEPLLYSAVCSSRSPCLSGVLSVPDHLPFNDNHFDYTVVVAGLEFWSNVEQVMVEIDRVTTSGCIVLFTNRLSLWGMEQLWASRFNPKRVVPGKMWRSGQVSALLKKVFARRAVVMASTLLPPSFFWCKTGIGRSLSWLVPLPVGAIAGVRIDFGAMKTGTPLLLPVGQPVIASDT